MLKGSVLPENITIFKVSIPYNRPSNHVRQKSTESKGERKIHDSSYKCQYPSFT
jgi:hypothetical protein